jgi:hypothetical protein
MRGKPIVKQGILRSRSRDKVKEDHIEDSGLATISEAPVDDVASLSVDSHVLGLSSSRGQSTGAILPALNRAPSQTVKEHLQS